MLKCVLKCNSNSILVSKLRALTQFVGAHVKPSVKNTVTVVYAYSHTICIHGHVCASKSCRGAEKKNHLPRYIEELDLKSISATHRHAIVVCVAFHRPPHEAWSVCSCCRVLSSSSSSPFLFLLLSSYFTGSFNWPPVTLIKQSNSEARKYLECIKFIELNGSLNK